MTNAALLSASFCGRRRGDDEAECFLSSASCDARSASIPVASICAVSVATLVISPVACAMPSRRAWQRRKWKKKKKKNHTTTRWQQQRGQTCNSTMVSITASQTKATQDHTCNAPTNHSHLDNLASFRIFQLVWKNSTVRSAQWENATRNGTVNVGGANHQSSCTIFNWTWQDREQ